MPTIRKTLTTFLTILLLILLLPACSDAAQIVPDTCAHKYKGWTIIKTSTCLESGVKSNTCSICGYTETLSMPALPHTEVIDDAVEATCTTNGKTQGKHCSICKTVLITQETIPASHKYDGGKTTIQATCKNEGVKIYTCTECGNAYTETLSKTSHQYDDGTITVPPTCENEGKRTYSCMECGNSKIEITASLGHDPNLNHVCTRCDKICPIKLTMTGSEIEQANKIENVLDTSIISQKEDNRFCLTFSLQDSFSNYLKAPVAVEIEIKNDDGVVVFKGAKAVNTSDFSDWMNNYGQKLTTASVYISYSDITEGSTPSGTLSFKIYNDYVSIKAAPLTINNDLPVMPSTVTLPPITTIIHDFKYDGSIDSSVQIIDITYEISDNDLIIFFTGKKIYDSEGEKHRQSCKVKWKLYDSEGYLLASQTFYSSNIVVGENFKNEEAYARNVIVHGETYSLEIFHLD